MRVTRTTDKNGFTIVELMVATVIFSMVLLLLATAIVQVGRIFYKGTTINRTQDTARAVADDITQAVQFGASNSVNFWQSSSASYGGVLEKSLCLGEVRYSYTLNTSLGNTTGQTPHVLWKDRFIIGQTCSPLDLRLNAPSPTGQELLGENMRVTSLDVPALAGGTSIWKINKLTIAYGATDDIFAKNADGTPDYSKCASTGNGGQFCAISTISTSVTKRL